MAKKEKPKKSEEELATARKDKIRHAVRRIDDWTEKVVRGMESRKCPLTENEKEKVVEHLIEGVRKVESAVNQVDSEKSKFDF